MKSGVGITGKQNVSLLDKWSLVHLFVGAVVGAVGVSPFPALSAAVLYEFVEYLLEHPHGSKIFGTKRPESTENSIADVTVYMAAYLVARETTVKLRDRKCRDGDR